MTGHEEWTAAQTEATVTVDGREHTMAYYEAGAEQSGPPVVFLHGIPTWSFLWRDIAPSIAEDRHVVAPDMLGYGNSTMDDGFDRSIRVQEQALDSLLAHLDAETVDIVAHDIGGGVAIRYAAHNADSVRQLVLSNAVCYDSWPVEFIANLGVPSAMQELSAEEVNAKLDFAFGDGLYDDEPHEAFVEGMKAPWQSSNGRTSLSRNAAATNTNHTTEIQYGDITAETLLLWGSNDILQPLSYAKRLREDLQDATLVELDRAYHWVVEDRTDAYREELHRFLIERPTS